MKSVVTLLSVVCLVLAAVFYMFYNKEQNKAKALAQAQASLSNQVAEVRTKLALEHGTSTRTQSNLQQVLDRRTGELLANSNRLVQVHLLLTQTEEGVRALRTQLESRAAALATLQAQQDEQILRLETLAPLQRELAATKQLLAQSITEREEQAQALGRIRVEKADLERKLEDVAFLRLELKRAEDRAALRKRMATPGYIDASDSRVQLELQADGTVRLAPIPEIQAAK